MLARSRRHGSFAMVLCMIGGLLLGIASQASADTFDYTFTVNSTGDGGDVTVDGVCNDGTGHCTLHAAIDTANQTPVFSHVLIAFDLPGSGIQTISPATDLPAANERATLIDGTTQPGYAGSPLVRLDGGGTVSSGLTIGTGGSHSATGSGARGLEITRFSGSGILIGFNNNITVASSLIGTDAAGSSGLGNGTGVTFSGAGHIIGGPNPGDGNVISGNVGAGIHVGDGLPVHFASGTIQGNLIGLAPDGVTPLPNGGSGIRLQGAFFNTEGSSASNEILDNTISANASDGIDSDAAQFIIGNRIGTTADGTAAAGNGGEGITIHVPAGAEIRDNTISANGGAGIRLDIGGAATFSGNNVVAGNRIGTTADGTGDLGNAGDGIRILGPGTQNDPTATIGGTTEPDRNVIRNNGGAGVRFSGGSSIVAIVGNSIDDNDGLGIDEPDPPFNPPSQTSAGLDGSTLTVEGSVGQTGFSTRTVDVYASPTCDPSGSGEGAVHVGSVQAGGFFSQGEWTFSGTTSGVFPGDVITTTARNSQGTSAFSSCLEVAGPSDLELTQTESADPVQTDDDLVYTITVINHGPGIAYPTVVDFVNGAIEFGGGSAIPSQGSCVNFGYPDIWQCHLGAVPAGGSATVDVHEVSTEAGTITSDASVTNAAADTNPGDESARDSTTVVPASTDLAVTVEPSATTVDPGEQLQYTITVTNQGAKPARGVHLAVDLPDGGILQSPACDVPGDGTLQCSVGTIPPGGSPAMIVFEALFAPGTRTLAATVSAATTDPNPGNDTASADVDVTPQPGVTYVEVRPSGFSAAKLKLTRGATVEFDLMGPAADAHQIRITGGLVSQDLTAPTPVRAVFKGAGTYTVRDLAHGTSMKIKVPMKAGPKTGPVGGGYKLTWASGAPGAGFLFDVQIKRPGTSTWVFLKSDTTLAKMSFIPDAGPGTYSFRARLRQSDTGDVSGWSSAVSITAT